MLSKRTVAALAAVAGLILIFGSPGVPAHADTQTADGILIKKSARKLYLLHHGRVIDDFTISLGGAPTGAKEREGDNRTPEGHYLIDYKNPNSQYHLALHVSYPNAGDLARAHNLGVDPGGEIMIHGLPNDTTTPAADFLGSDWTAGCIAVSDKAIREIYATVQPGTPITISP